jgi:hypothetical protein
MLLSIQVIPWEIQQDIHLLRAINKTIPVVSVMGDDNTIHMVGSSCIPLKDITVHTLPYPKSTNEIFFTQEEITAVLNSNNLHLQDILLFMNSKDIRFNGSEAAAFKVGLAGV